MDIEETDGELGVPEGVDYDVNAHIQHTLNSLAEQNVRSQWKIGQHAAEIDALKQKLAEVTSERDAYKQALEETSDDNAKLQGSLEREANILIPDGEAPLRSVP